TPPAMGTPPVLGDSLTPETPSAPPVELPTASPSPGKGRRAVAVPGLCALDKDPGTACADFSLRWYHRRDTGACERFWYGGCGGNANRFGTERDCVHTCVGVFWGAVSRGGAWFFEEPGRCSLFWYGGCGGSRNRFESREQCEAVCMAPGTGGTRDPRPTNLRRQSDKPAVPRRGAGGAMRSPQQTPTPPPPPVPCQPLPQILQPPGRWGAVGGGWGWGAAGDAPVPPACRRRAGGDAVAVGAAARQT
uniref:BPTI/Kunitz inhibitor domain-containing protein n=1 Tax=Anser brachyrhynchus TaxID=132585 RepID=A0A8B9BJX1_9AVES